MMILKKLTTSKIWFDSQVKCRPGSQMPVVSYQQWLCVTDLGRGCSGPWCNCHLHRHNVLETTDAWPTATNSSILCHNIGFL